MSFRGFLLKTFTWWNGQTFGTQFYTARYGKFVGSDEFGNRYYRAIGARIDPNVGSERRWVIYNGPVEASAVPPGWRGWLAHTVDVPPSEEEYQPRPWQKPYVANQTGTERAYRPRGSQLSFGQRPAATGDYVPWKPNE